MIIKKTPNIRRRNHRPNGRRNNFSRNGFDNSNPHRPKGSVSKILEKYTSLAQDAASNGDRIKAEGFFQHAEHYQRILNTISINENKTKDNQTSVSNDDNPLSRTDRAIVGTKERLEKKLENDNTNGENKENVAPDNGVISDGAFTPDGVEALKAFTSPIVENKEN